MFVEIFENLTQVSYAYDSPVIQLREILDVYNKRIEELEAENLGLRVKVETLEHDVVILSRIQNSTVDEVQDILVTQDTQSKLIKDFKMRRCGDHYLIDGCFGHSKYEARFEEGSLKLENLQGSHSIDLDKYKDYKEIKGKLDGILELSIADESILRTAITRYLTVVYPYHIIIDYDRDDTARFTLRMNGDFYILKIFTDSKGLNITISDEKYNVIHEFTNIEALLDFLNGNLKSQKIERLDKDIK